MFPTYHQDLVHTFNISSSIKIIFSESLSVYRWYTVLNFYFVPIASCKLFQNLDANIVSPFETIEIGIPYNLNSFLTRACSYYSMVNDILTGRKPADFVSRSIHYCLANIVSFCKSWKSYNEIYAFDSHFHSDPMVKATPKVFDVPLSLANNPCTYLQRAL